MRSPCPSCRRMFPTFCRKNEELGAVTGTWDPSAGFRGHFSYSLMLTSTVGLPFYRHQKRSFKCRNPTTFQKLIHNNVRLAEISAISRSSLYHLKFNSKVFLVTTFLTFCPSIGIQRASGELNAAISLDKPITIDSQREIIPLQHNDLNI